MNKGMDQTKTTNQLLRDVHSPTRGAITAGNENHTRWHKVGMSNTIRVMDEKRPVPFSAQLKLLLGFMC